MKLCKNCEHFIPKNFFSDDGPLCKKSAYTDPVYGEVVYQSCFFLRRSIAPGDCGPQGIFWRPK